MAGASGLVPSVFLTRKAILMDSGSMKDVPLVSGMRQTLEVVGEKELSAGEVLRVMPRRHVAGVARLQLVAQALISSSWAPAVTTSMLVYIHTF